MAIFVKGVQIFIFGLLTQKSHIIARKRVLWHIVCEIVEGALALESCKNARRKKIKCHVYGEKSSLQGL